MGPPRSLSERAVAAPGGALPPRDPGERWVAQTVSAIQGHYAAEMDDVRRLHEEEADEKPEKRDEE